jgi:hypothetical protein
VSCYQLDWGGYLRIREEVRKEKRKTDRGDHESGGVEDR